VTRLDPVKQFTDITLPGKQESRDNKYWHPEQPDLMPHTIPSTSSLR
jgi:hypothetical protein